MNWRGRTRDYQAMDLSFLYVTAHWTINFGCSTADRHGRMRFARRGSSA